jgi:selenocysteine lyase/cysteine desulfurase
MSASRRRDFEIAPGEVWFNGGYFSPAPRVARAAVEEGYRIKAMPGTMPADSMISYPDRVRERLGAVLGLPADEIGITTSTSFGAMLIAQGIRWQPGDRVLLGPDEFPGDVYPWLALEERGVEVEFTGRQGHPLTAPELERSIAKGGRVRVLAIGATHYLTGDVHPLAELSRVAHAHGALLVVDAAQTAGSVALDWASLGLDAVLMSGYKWLLGPYGSGAIWVRPEVRDSLVNINGNWVALAQSDLDRVMREVPREFAPHGRMLDVGESASYLNLSYFGAGLELLQSIGVANVEAYHRSMQDRLVAAVAGMPLRPLTTLDAPHRSPLLMFDAEPGVDLGRLAADLAQRQVHVSVRTGRLRVSPGIWSDESEVEVFAEAAARSLLDRRPV